MREQQSSNDAGRNPLDDEVRCELVIACVRLLFVNGQGTEQVMAAGQRLIRALGLSATVHLSWGEVQLQLAEGCRSTWRIAANPAGVDMARVTEGMQVVDDVEAGRMAPEIAKTIAAISRSSSVSGWLFAFAAGAAAAAMSVLFGVEQIGDVSMIFASACLGALLRRVMLRTGTNALAQPFAASLLAGIVAAVSFRYQLITSLRLVALCPCVILVPGAHVLNGLSDLMSGRLNLGIARMVHAGLIVAAITTGLLFGLVICGATLPLVDTPRAVPLWQHMLAGGTAVAAFGVLFSMPLRQLPIPVLVGALAQSVRWGALAAGFGVGAAALAACLVIGAILMPVARLQRLPFAAIGFVTVVSMIPASYLFTMASGTLQIATGQDTTLELIGFTLTSGTNAMLVILAISLGLVTPKLVLEYLDERRGRSRLL